MHKIAVEDTDVEGFVVVDAGYALLGLYAVAALVEVLGRLVLAFGVYVP